MGQPPTETGHKLKFIRDMLEQLVTMVPAQAGPTLPHLIAMARLEATELLSSFPADN